MSDGRAAIGIPLFQTVVGFGMMSSPGRLAATSAAFTPVLAAMRRTTAAAASAVATVTDFASRLTCFSLYTAMSRPRLKRPTDNSYAERFECLEEERFARCIVADSEFDVVKHEFS